MSLRTVTVTIPVDPEDYCGATDSPRGAIELVLEMLRGDADLPGRPIVIECDGMQREVEDHT